MTKSADLKAQLSKALPKPKAERAHKPRKRGAGKPEGTAVRKGSVGLSVSLFPPDLERLDQIKAFMATLGVRSVADSQALRLALRRTPIDEDMLAIYTAMRAEDGRGGGNGAKQ
jgi:hypothetical protein